VVLEVKLEGGRTVLVNPNSPVTDTYKVLIALESLKEQLFNHEII
jgi:hypothetical protein